MVVDGTERNIMENLTYNQQLLMIHELLVVLLTVLIVIFLNYLEVNKLVQNIYLNVYIIILLIQGLLRLLNYNCNSFKIYTKIC